MRGLARPLICLGALLAVLAPAQAQEAAGRFSVRRFMLAVGTNDGGDERVKLRYASTDAKSVAKVFQDLGGVDSADRIVLMDPDRETFRHSLGRLDQLVTEAGPRHRRVEVIIYYSGHSDERGLMLGNDCLDYSELRATVDRMPADVRIIILDSCASGALTRLKGGRHRAPFLMDASAEMTGHAFLTSSSDDEAAQESDRIEASFFTHALVSGLRGAADASQDGRVTLNEAYQFAFHETLARTEGSRSGPQHPGYDIQLVGAGDLVMTDLRGTSAGLVLNKGMFGRLHVRDSRGALVVELEKPTGRKVELGLDPGEYRLVLDQDGQFHGARLTLTDGGRTELSMAHLNPIAVEYTTARGDQLPPAREVVGGVPEEDLLYRDVSFCVLPGIGTSGRDAERTISDLSINLTLGRNHGVDGCELGYIGNWNLGNVRGLQIAGSLNLVEGELDGVQLSSLLNRVWGEARHVQMSGAVNSVGKSFHGVEVAGLVNIVEQDCEYVQIAGLANWVSGEFKGAQCSGTFCMAKTLEGLQASGAFNGVRSFEGAQVSIVNLAGSGEGAQIGVVNIAKEIHGTQIGVVNVADKVDGAPIGLLNFIRQGRHNLSVWGGSAPAATAGLKLGSDRFYSILAAGYDGESAADKGRRYYGLGIGTHIPSGRSFAEVEFLGFHIDEMHDRDDDKAHLLTQLRLGIGWQFAPRFAIIGGASVNTFISERDDGAAFAKGTWYDEKDGDTWVRMWPSVFFGIQI